jgi:hypothetical protein
MPAFIKTPADERKWNAIKHSVAKQRGKSVEDFTDRDWATVNGAWHKSEGNIEKFEEIMKSIFISASSGMANSEDPLSPSSTLTGMRGKGGRAGQRGMKGMKGVSGAAGYGASLPRPTEGTIVSSGMKIPRNKIAGSPNGKASVLQASEDLDKSMGFASGMKMPKAKKQPDISDKPSVFFKSEAEVKHPTLCKMMDLLKKSRSKKLL